MAQTPTGTRYFLYTTLGALVAVTGISNAAEAVVTAAGHTFANGDVVFLPNSGWGALSNRAFVVSGVTATTFVLAGVDTTSTNVYPTGLGAGSAAEALTPVQVTQVLTSSVSGGEAKKVNYRHMEDGLDQTINDGFNPVTRTMELDSDAFGTPGYAALRTLTDTGGTAVLKTLFKRGGYTLTSCTVALNEEVIQADGQVDRVRVDISGRGRSVRVAA